MEKLKLFIITELQVSRKDLLDIPVSELSCASVYRWFKKNEPGLRRADSLIKSIPGVNISLLLRGYQDEVPKEVIQDLIDRIITVIDKAILEIDEKQVVIPVFDSLILKVKDVKLATLLNEFNRGKESNPNMSAIGFRTILTIIIRERAKLVDGTSSLATKTDLGFEIDIKKAIEEHIFDSAEEKLLRRYLTGGKKDLCDNVAHKPGENTLVSKDDLNDSVNLLNKLLPTILGIDQ